MRSNRDEFLDRARELHRRSIVIDTHVDTTQRLIEPDFDMASRNALGHLDIPRLRDGGVDAVFFAVYAGGPIEPGDGAPIVREQMNRLRRMSEANAGALALCRTASDVREAKRSGRIALLMAIEGGYLLDDSIERLREYAEAGATYLTLTHSFHTSWCDSAGVHEDLPPRHHGLTDFGREVVRELNRLGMMVDVSHVSDEAFWQVLETAAAPVVATHSSCRAVSPHRRNLTDDMMRAVARSGGVVQINFSAAFVDPTYPKVDPVARKRWQHEGRLHGEPFSDHVTPLRVLVDHFDHALRVVGPRHAGIGTDFDGVPQLPEGMEDCSRLPWLTAELLRRGWSEEDLVHVLGGNVLRVMEACAEVARTMRSGPSLDPAVGQGNRRA